jgi:hypothetical protein
MTIEPFVIQDYAEIEMANGVGFEHWGLKCGVLHILKGMEMSKTFWTVRDEQGILGIGGYHHFFGGVCEVSLFPSKRFVEKPLAGYRVIKRFVKSWSMKFKRVQLNCRAEYLFIRFAKRLGFVEEGRLKKFDHQDRDHIIMAIVR